MTRENNDVRTVIIGTNDNEWMGSNEVLSANEGYYEHLVAQKGRLLSEISVIDEEMKKMSFIVALLKGEKTVPVTEDTVESNSRRGQEDAVPEVVCGNAKIADIANCQSQREAMYRIAKKNDGIVDLNPASALVVAAGMSKTTARAVTGTLHNYLSNSEDFEWIAPSIFRLKSGG